MDNEKLNSIDENREKPSVVPDQDPIDKSLEEEAFRIKRKKDLTQVGLVQLLYILCLNIVTSLVSGLSEDMGIIMMGGTIISLTIVLIVFRAPNIIDIVKDKKKEASFKDILYFFGLGLIFNMIMGLIINFLVESAGLDITNITELIQNEVSTTTYLYVVLLGPLVEEILYRGIILQRLRPYGKMLGLIFSSLFFGLMHQNLVQSFSVLGIALVLGYVATYYSFKAAVLVHILNNLFVMLVSALADYLTFYYLLLSLVMLIMIYSTYRFFSKNNRDLLRKKLHFEEREKENIKALLSNWAIILVILIHIAGMILSEVVLTAI